MTMINDPATVDLDKLMAFVFKAVDEVGATLNSALVVLGDKLGLYRAMAGAGSLTSDELAERTGTTERSVREWLNAQAAGGYVAFNPETGRYLLPPEQTMALTDSSSVLEKERITILAGRPATSWPSTATASSRSTPFSCTRGRNSQKVSP